MQPSRHDPLTIARWLLDAAVIGLVAVVLGAVVLGRVVPMTGNQSLIIGGPSMEPTLPLGSAVVIQPVAPADISVGDIVSVKSGDGRAIYTHRVVRRLALDGVPYLETKGDNNEAADAATVPATAVIGRVMLVVPLMGFVLTWLSAVSGVAFLLGLGALLVLTAMLIDLIQDDRRRRAAASTGSTRPSDRRLSVGDRRSPWRRRTCAALRIRRCAGPSRTGTPRARNVDRPFHACARRSRPSHPAALSPRDRARRGAPASHRPPSGGRRAARHRRDAGRAACRSRWPVSPRPAPPAAASRRMSSHRRPA